MGVRRTTMLHYYVSYIIMQGIYHCNQRICNPFSYHFPYWSIWIWHKNVRATWWNWRCRFSYIVWIWFNGVFLS